MCYWTVTLALQTDNPQPRPQPFQKRMLRSPAMSRVSFGPGSGSRPPSIASGLYAQTALPRLIGRGPRYLARNFAGSTQISARRTVCARQGRARHSPRLRPLQLAAADDRAGHGHISHHLSTLPARRPGLTLAPVGRWCARTGRPGRTFFQERRQIAGAIVTGRTDLDAARPPSRRASFKDLEERDFFRGKRQSLPRPIARAQVDSKSEVSTPLNPLVPGCWKKSVGWRTCTRRRQSQNLQPRGWHCRHAMISWPLNDGLGSPWP